MKSLQVVTNPVDQHDYEAPQAYRAYASGNTQSPPIRLKDQPRNATTFASGHSGSRRSLMFVAPSFEDPKRRTVTPIATLSLFSSKLFEMAW